MKELFNLDYQRTILTPSKKNTKSLANSPASRPKNQFRLVDKNLLDIGGATLKLRDSQGFTKVIKSKSKNKGKTPNLILGTLGEERKIEIFNFKDYFD